ncbi:MAG TPA: bifunctional aldolase/short-chain dehydrogenase [Polyangia bacterium]|nr:bifunctional aldolase/short-chain dehydrogenase [Polyangia bacterium]
MDYRWNDDEVAKHHGDDLAQLIYLSNVVGTDPTLTQPGGGNSSVKRQETDFAGRTVDVLRVKGSGTDLRTIAAAGFTGLRMDDLGFLRRRDQMTDEEMMAFMRACMLDAREPAPSVETPLHSVLRHRFVVHTHDFATQALTDTPRPEALVREALGPSAAYIDYVRPGFPLARAVSQLGPLPDAAKGLVLGRHGLIAWGHTAKDCYDNLFELINRSERFIASKRGSRPFIEVALPTPSVAERRAKARQLLPVLRAGLGSDRLPVLHWDGSDEAVAFAGAAQAPALVARGMVTPEHILRCGRVALAVQADVVGLPAADAARVLDQSLKGFAAETRAVYERQKARTSAPMLEPTPRVVLLPGLGMVTAMKDKANAVVGNLCYRHAIRVMEAAESLGGFRFLDEADAVEFEYWPLELAKLSAPEKELSRQVALVTGAASGIGRAIADRFAAEGAHLVLTDIAGGALRDAAAAIAKACKDPRRVVAVEADATRPADAAHAVTEAVLGFGGLDILVCNAGFIQAGPIDHISPEAWARHFDVNVGGYFLAVREAVAVMKAQGRGTIIFNASKGAFAPTADNAAYASSKAAVAALARNLATELGPSGIRVNYINADFIDTPLMNQLIAQRAAQRGITPAQQAEEYRRRNLLGVGPIPPSAVAEAALFFASPRARYTTGGVLTVDGGIKESMPR